MGNAIQLDHHQVASRLSYFLWDSIPDEQLTLAADEGQLGSASAISLNSAPSKMELVDVGADKRSGILTQAGLMAAFAKPTTNSPVFRGLFVMNQLLCAETGAAPLNIPSLSIETKPGESPMTMRQRQTQSHAAASCAACHKLIDGIGIGFGFEHYDAVGAWRDKDNGITVDSSGELVGIGDVDGTFDGVVQLGEGLSSSVQVQQCVVTNWSAGPLER